MTSRLHDEHWGPVQIITWSARSNRVRKIVQWCRPASSISEMQQRAGGQWLADNIFKDKEIRTSGSWSQAHSQVLRFWRGKYILGWKIFVYIIYLKQFFIKHNTWGYKNLGRHWPRFPPVAEPCWGTFIRTPTSTWTHFKYNTGKRMA